MLPPFLVLSLTRFIRSHAAASRHTKEPSLNTDLSVAPEIALLAAPLVATQTGPQPDARTPRTDGRLAGDLADLAAAPQRWWDLVRFDAGGPLRIPLPGAPGAWLLVVPPGAAADCDCGQATALAGEAVETSGPSAAGAARPLRARAGSSCTAAAPRTACSPQATGIRSRCMPQPRRSVRINSRSSISNGPCAPRSSSANSQPRPGILQRGALTPEDYPESSPRADARPHRRRPELGHVTT